jgi:hypothetical protein
MRYKQLEFRCGVKSFFKNFGIDFNRYWTKISTSPDKSDGKPEEAANKTGVPPESTYTYPDPYV